MLYNKKKRYYVEIKYKNVKKKRYNVKKTAKMSKKTINNNF